LQQGYIQITLKNSSYSRNYQFKVVSGTNVIKDWTAPVQQMIVAFKLNCANYTIYVRDYNDIGCQSEILNVSIPCLTTTTSSTTTVAPTTTSTTTTTTSTTTQFQYAPCAFYYNLEDRIYYKDIQTNVDKLLVSNCLQSSDVSLYNGNLYLKGNNADIQKIDLATLSKTLINLIIPTNLSQKIQLCNSATHDSVGNLYLGNGDIYKFTPIGNDYTYDSTIVNLFDSFPSQGDIAYVANIDAFAMTSINKLLNKSVIIIVKADGSNLILNEINLGNDVSSFAIFVYNNELYCTHYGQEKNYLLKVNIETGQVTQDLSKKMLTYAYGGTQNSNCLTLNYNNQFKFGTMTYVCTNVNIFNLQFDILNGGGQYEYSTNNLGFTPISGTRFDANLSTDVSIIYINDIILGKSYKFRRDPSVVCNSGFTTTTTTTTTVACVQISAVVISGTNNVEENSITSYNVSSYNGSVITDYLWEVEGGVINGVDNIDNIAVTWSEGVTTGRVTVFVTNCAGTKRYFKTINISNATV
jgi:hypothetical protein